MPALIVMLTGVTSRCRLCSLTCFHAFKKNAVKIAHQHEQLVVRNAEMERSKQVRRVNNRLPHAAAMKMLRLHLLYLCREAFKKSSVARKEVAESQ